MYYVVFKRRYIIIMYARPPPLSSSNRVIVFRPRKMYLRAQHKLPCPLNLAIAAPPAATVLVLSNHLTWRGNIIIPTDSTFSF